MRAATYLLFDGIAEEAYKFYAQVFECPMQEPLQYFSEDTVGELAGKLKPTHLEIAGHAFMIADSPNPIGFGFTPSISTFIEFDDEEDLIRIHDYLCAEGEALMPLDDYGFSQQFAWVQDKFGVTWQLNLAL